MAFVLYFLLYSNFDYQYSILKIDLMEQKCWKVRDIFKPSPSVTEGSSLARDKKRQKKDTQQLLVVQCNKCKAILNRSFIPMGRVPNGRDRKITLSSLESIGLNVGNGQILANCSSCKSLVASLHDDWQIRLFSSSLSLHLLQQQLLSIKKIAREPYDAVGAFSSLGYRKYITELLRLSLCKQTRYRFTMKHLNEKLQKSERLYKGLYNMIILNQSAHQSRNQQNRNEYSKTLPSTNIEHISPRSISLVSYGPKEDRLLSRRSME